MRCDECGARIRRRALSASKTTTSAADDRLDERGIQKIGYATRRPSPSDTAGPGLLASAQPGLTHVVTSTISVAFARELELLHEEAALGYVSAPVLGRPSVAANGKLNILAAGKADAVAAIEPLLAPSATTARRSRNEH